MNRNVSELVAVMISRCISKVKLVNCHPTNCLLFVGWTQYQDRDDMMALNPYLRAALNPGWKKYCKLLLIFFIIIYFWATFSTCQELKLIQNCVHLMCASFFCRVPTCLLFYLKPLQCSRWLTYEYCAWGKTLVLFFFLTSFQCCGTCWKESVFVLLISEIHVVINGSSCQQPELSRRPWKCGEMLNFEQRSTTPHVLKILAYNYHISNPQHWTWMKTSVSPVWSHAWAKAHLVCRIYHCGGVLFYFLYLCQPHICC